MTSSVAEASPLATLTSTRGEAEGCVAHRDVDDIESMHVDVAADRSDTVGIRRADDKNRQLVAVDAVAQQDVLMHGGVPDAREHSDEASRRPPLNLAIELELQRI